MSDFFIKELQTVQISELIATEKVVVGLDVGDKTVGISVSDRGIRIATGITTLERKGYSKDFERVVDILKLYKIGLIIFGWPVQMNGIAGPQCEKVLSFITQLYEYLPVDYAKWDERFSTSAVESIMIQADLSRKKRKKVIDKGAATYILQGALDFLNRCC
ncbi:MAG: Holliday junction resolvase RuvX [Alphaproteobacteria bacterium]|nr:Holliday junction resolvase RuvX [Alphaproteobacteria bacterium]